MRILKEASRKLHIPHAIVRIPQTNVSNAVHSLQIPVHICTTILNVKMYQEIRRTSLFALAAAVGVGGLEGAARLYALTTASETGAMPVKTHHPLIRRSAANHIRERAAGRCHLLVCGPPNVGKTTALKLALDGRRPIQGILTPTTFLPFYVDLRAIVATASHTEDARSMSTCPTGAPRDLAARVDATFSKAADDFQIHAIEALRAAFLSRLELEFKLWLGRYVATFAPAAPAAVDSSPSIARYLKRFVTAASSAKSISLAASLLHSPHDYIPVLVVDEVRVWVLRIS